MTNLLANPGFETGTLSRWQNVRLSASVVTEWDQSGSYSLKGIADPANGSGGYLYGLDSTNARHPCTFGDSFKFRFVIRTLDQPISVNINVAEYDSSNANISSNLRGLETVPAWTVKTFEYSATPTSFNVAGVLPIVYVYPGGSSAATFYLDDAEFVKNEDLSYQIPENLIVNGNFENTSVAGWVSNTNQQYNPFYSVLWSYTGKYSMRWLVSSSDTSSYLYPRTNQLVRPAAVRGETVYIRFVVHTTDQSVNVGCNIFEYDSSGTSLESQTGQVITQPANTDQIYTFSKTINNANAVSFATIMTIRAVGSNPDTVTNVDNVYVSRNVPPFYRTYDNQLDRLRLEISTQDSAGLKNYNPNPDGKLGTFGWHGYNSDSLTFSAISDSLGTNYFVVFSTNRNTTAVGISSGKIFFDPKYKYLSVSYKNPPDLNLGGINNTDYCKVIYYFYTNEFLFVGSTYSYVNKNVDNQVVRTPAVAIPANAAYIQMTFFLTNSAGTPITNVQSTNAAPRKMQINNIMVTAANTAAELNTTYPYSSGENDWEDILSSAAKISINRERANLGTIETVLYDQKYDPSVNEKMTSGNPIRVTVDTRGFGEYTPLFTGSIVSALPTYQKTVNGKTFPVITVNGIDNYQKAAEYVVGASTTDLYGMAQILENSYFPCPFNMSNYLAGAGTGLNSVAYLGSLTAGDAVQMSAYSQFLKNTTGADVNDPSVTDYSWTTADYFVDSFNIFVGRVSFSRAKNSFSDTSDVLSYGDIDATYTDENIINELTVNWKRSSGSTTSTVETTYGPYKNLRSQYKIGRRDSEIDLVGNSTTETNTDVQNYSKTVFQRNAYSVFTVKSIDYAVSSNDYVLAAATTDMCDLIGVIYLDKVNGKFKVVGINHEIDVNLWEVHYDLEDPRLISLPRD